MRVDTELVAVLKDTEEEIKVSSTIDRTQLLEAIKMLNNKISRKQRANLFEPLKEYLTKPVFNQIVRGIFVSISNVPIALHLKNKMTILSEQNEKIFQ